MKALSIQQPWAWAIMHAGKHVENRSWPTSYRGRILIHAGKSKASYERERTVDWRKTYGAMLPKWGQMPTGVIFGSVELVACLHISRTAEFFKVPEIANANGLVGDAMKSPWAEGPWCWILRDPRPFERPIDCRGALQLFAVRDDILSDEIRFASAR